MKLTNAQILNVPFNHNLTGAYTIVAFWSHLTIFNKAYIWGRCYKSHLKRPGASWRDFCNSRPLASIRRRKERHCRLTVHWLWVKDFTFFQCMWLTKRVILNQRTSLWRAVCLGLHCFGFILYSWKLAQVGSFHLVCSSKLQALFAVWTVTKWSWTYLLGIVISFLEALFSPIFHPGHEFVACVFSLPQIASSFSELVYCIRISEMMVHGGHACDQSCWWKHCTWGEWLFVVAT